MHRRSAMALHVTASLLALALLASAAGASEPRARDLGIPFDGTPGPLNAISDVAGLTVGYSTLIQGRGAHAVRTGVTVILPRGRATLDRPVFAGAFSLNGNGEMTGLAWVEESGLLEGPVAITNTHSVGVVHDALIAWRVKQGTADPSGYWWSLPIVAETWDGDLSDINGFHIEPRHVFAALQGAKGGAIAEGNVGGGTGMICHEFKGGTGTSSRALSIDGKPYVVAALVQANYGVRDELRIAGVPVGKLMPLSPAQPLSPAAPAAPVSKDSGSIIIVVATDAPLLPTQLKRVAKRAALGLARNGSYSGNGSGDLFIAFSTANEVAEQTHSATFTALGNDQLDGLFLATVQAVEESIINALIAAKTMTGVGSARVPAIDHAQLRAIMQRHGRIAKPAP
ncbi:MAG TPA: P1 family peptidase [Polyangiales bacterium]|nr:P1 family peptidase [Polyangiales bacterium]